MHRYAAMAVAIGAAVLGGCKTAPYVNSHIETVNAEYRQLEDYVYCLEDENARLQQELSAVQAGRPADATPRRERPGILPRRDRTTPSSPSSNLDVPSIEVPAVPSETPPRRSTNRPEVDGPPEPHELEPPSIELPSHAPNHSEQVPAAPDAPETLPPAKPADAKVTHLFLNPVHTGGSDFDSQAGDDGLSVVIEPRNASEEYVPQAGSVSIVVLDPSKAGEAARVARWDFDSAATQQKLDARKSARGIGLQLPWPAGPPTSDKLHLFVRYETPDGRRLQTDREIYVTQPGKVSQRWTPRQGPRKPLPIAQAPEASPASAPAVVSATATATAVTPAAPPWSPLR